MEKQIENELLDWIWITHATQIWFVAVDKNIVDPHFIYHTRIINYIYKSDTFHAITTQRKKEEKIQQQHETNFASSEECVCVCVCVTVVFRIT